jgi:hypothetical protein
MPESQHHIALLITVLICAMVDRIEKSDPTPASPGITRIM